jgi:non-homologous end joining protein Ku
MPVKPQPTHRQTNVINLMDALRRSVEGAKGGPQDRPPARKPTAKARATRAKSKSRKAG